jgi:hypothetical protein
MHFVGRRTPPVEISVVEPDPGFLKAQSKIPNPLRRGPPVDGNFDGRGPPSHGPIQNPQSSRRGPPVDGNFDGRGPPSHGPNPNSQSSPAGSAGGRKFRRAGSAVPRPKPQSKNPNGGLRLRPPALQASPPKAVTSSRTPRRLRLFPRIQAAPLPRIPYP